MKESAIACILLALLIFCGIFIRVDAATETMWLDECHTAWAVDAETSAEVASRAADGNQPPLYFWLVWFTTNGLGLSEFSLRIVSLIAGAGLLAVAPLWAKSLTDRWSAAVLVATLIAFDGQFIYYASEARSYALVQFIGLLQAIFFWRCLALEETEGSQPKTVFLNIAAWTLLSIALPLLHYTSVWILISEGALLLIVSLMRRKFPLQFLIAGFVIVAAIISRWENVSMIFNRRGNWDAVSSIDQLWIDVEPWLVHWMLIPIGIALVMWLLNMIQTPGQKESAEKSNSWVLWLWIGLWAIIGPAGIAIADACDVAPMALVRYSIVCWVALALFAALCLRLFSPSVSWLVAAVILGSSFFGNWWVAEFVETGRLPIFRTEDWVTTARQLAESDSTEPIFQLGDVLEDVDALTEQDERFQKYLLFPILGADAVRGGKRLEETHDISAASTWNYLVGGTQCRSVHEHKGCWLIVRSDLDYALIIPQELEDQTGADIEFKFLTNDRMPNSRVHLIRVRVKE